MITMTPYKDGSMRFAEKYAASIVRRRIWIAVGSLVLAVIAALVVRTLPVHTDFSALLPPDAPSVVDLRKIEKRSRVISSVSVVVESDDPQKRAAAASAVYARAKELPPELVSRVLFDERATRDLVWNNRWLFASTADLEHARDELRTRLREAKLKANPLYIELDEPVQVIHSSDGEFDRKLAEARAKHEESPELVSKDGRCQLVVLYMAFRAGDGDRATRLLDELKHIVGDVRASLPPGVELGLAGDMVVDQAEHTAILDGVVIAVAVTTVLVLGVLLMFFRSVLAVGALMWSLVVGTLVTFAFTRLTIGELNIATAFLSSIVVGNGINFGTLVAARYLEERRRGHESVDAVARTLRNTFTGTLAAALTAAVAYASLVVTDFRGFRHFGVIGGAGMVACWLSAFSVLPAVLSIVDRRGWLKPRAEPAIGRWLAKLIPRRSGVIVAIGLALTVVAGFETWRYFSDEPFENNFRNLRSQSAAAREEARWMKLSNFAFGRGVSSGFVMAVDDRKEVEPIVARLRALDEGKQPKQRLFARVTSIDDLLPADQSRKLELLAEIRGMLTPEAIDQLSEEDRAKALELRPPDDLRSLGEEDLPEVLRTAFTEADGARGRLIFALPGFGYDTWNAHHLIEFAGKVRGLDLGPTVLLGAEAFVFADVLQAIERDGPRATLVALLGAILVIVAILGRSRAAFVTLSCAAAGTAVMLALGSLFGLKVNFLDFVALPITIGIGIDYSVNIVVREREEGDAHRALATVGGAVVLCSATTIIGYGSLILSQNLAIRSFGLAAILGEITCLLVAVAFAPALSAALHRVRRSSLEREVAAPPQEQRERDQPEHRQSRPPEHGIANADRAVVQQQR